jgi:hypothetical protein
MKRQEAIEGIRSYAGLSNAFDMLEARLEDISNEALSDSLLSCGIIPETYTHDSSEEKKKNCGPSIVTSSYQKHFVPWGFAPAFYEQEVILPMCLGRLRIIPLLVMQRHLD